MMGPIILLFMLNGVPTFEYRVCSPVAKRSVVLIDRTIDNQRYRFVATPCKQA